MPRGPKGEKRPADVIGNVDDWMAPGERDSPSVNSEWVSLIPPTIDGVVLNEIRPVITRDGSLTELWRSDWNLDAERVDQVFQRSLDPGAINGWHAHVLTTDRLICTAGRVRLSLYDGRKSSASFGKVWERVIAAQRPTLVVVPPGVWHALTALGPTVAQVVNIVDRAYDYDAPDHRRLPIDTPLIPLKLR